MNCDRCRELARQSSEGTDRESRQPHAEDLEDFGAHTDLIDSVGSKGDEGTEHESWRPHQRGFGRYLFIWARADLTVTAPIS